MKVSGLFQPLDGTTSHSVKVASLLSSDWAEKVFVSTAFANTAGVEGIREALQKQTCSKVAYVGVRNGATSGQSLIALQACGARVYVVDTGTPSRIFHPKIYAAQSVDRAAVIVGSANLTHAGMNNNIEAGVYLDLDLSNADEAKIFSELTRPLAVLAEEHGDNCYEVKNKDCVEALMKTGIVEDEKNRSAPTASEARTGQGSGQNIPPKINLPFVPPPPKAATKKTKKAAKKARTTHPTPHYGKLLWAKEKLPKGDLQLLKKGHSSGVIRLTQSKFKVDGQNIDQTKYFRNKIFSDLNWKKEKGKREKANGKFCLVIGGVSVGLFDLDIVHDPAWEAGQNNYTTGLHVSPIKQHIAQDGLIGRTLRLFEDSDNPGRFVIDID